MIEVDHVRTNGTARLVEELFEIIHRPHLPPRHLGGDIHPVAPASGQSTAHRLFALSAQVDTPRVDIVYTAFDGTAYHGRGLVEIYVSVLHRQPQHTETQRRDLHAGPPHRAVLHLRIVIENLSRQPLPYDLFFNLLRQGFRTDYRTGSCGKKSAFKKITSIHIASRLSI